MWCAGFEIIVEKIDDSFFNTLHTVCKHDFFGLLGCIAMDMYIGSRNSELI